MMNARTILVASHRRSGTHWTIDAIRHNLVSVSESFLNLDRLLPWHDSPLSIPEFESLVGARERAVLVKTHTPPTLEPFGIDTSLMRFVGSLFQDSKVVYAYRDGRDVLVSLYYYMRHFNSRIREVSFSDFIRMRNEFDIIPHTERRLNRVEYWRFHVEHWLSQPDILPVSYEDFHADYERVVKAVAKRLGFQTAPDIKPVALHTSDYGASKLYRRALGASRMILRRGWASSSAVLPRKGIIGDWRQHFSERDISFFNSIAGDLLDDLGYL